MGELIHKKIDKYKMESTFDETTNQMRKKKATRVKYITVWSNKGLKQFNELHSVVIQLCSSGKIERGWIVYNTSRKKVIHNDTFTIKTDNLHKLL